jgi:acetoin utilization deacetylase AcuC-like enzyme
MHTAYITHPDCGKHQQQEGHPESSDRLHDVQDRLMLNHVLDFMPYIEAPEVTKDQLARVHDPLYIDHVESLSPDFGFVYLDDDTAMTPLSLRAANLAAGAGIKAVEMVVKGEVPNAFCNIRPPGHHALCNQAMGFCIFNNIAVAAAHALEEMGLERVAICDFDVHHGNGTEEIFFNDDRVLFCSTFQHPFYPFSNPESEKPHIIKCPLRGGAGSKEFRQVVTRDWLPALNAHKPQLVLISAGFDAHIEDDMGGMALIDDDYTWVTEQLKQVADEHAEGKIVSMLEGGYVKPALGRCATAHVRVLMGL